MFSERGSGIRTGAREALCRNGGGRSGGLYFRVGRTERDLRAYFHRTHGSPRREEQLPLNEPPKALRPLPGVLGNGCIFQRVAQPLIPLSILLCWQRL